MWYPAANTGGAPAPAITKEKVKAQASIPFADDDALLDQLIAAATLFAEKYCGIRIASQNVSVQCDSFADMAQFPVAPARTVTSIKYIDADGTEQTLPDTVYELRADGLKPSIALKYGQTWPAIRQGSRITVVAAVGFATVPADIERALLLYIADGYANRENKKDADWTAFDSLLCNYRRYA